MESPLRLVLRKLKYLRVIDERDLYLLHEQSHLRRLFELLNIDCVFDVGANTGQYTKMIRKYVGYRGPVVSFEPNPDVATILRENARGDNDWLVEEVALGATVGQATFYVTAADQMSSLRQSQTSETHLFKAQTVITKEIQVNVSTLEIELAKFHKSLRFERPFLKLDSQGSDFDIAVGAGARLNEFVGLQSELAIKRIYANAPSYNETLKFYQDNGFILSAFVPNNEGHFPYLIEADCIMFRKETT
jgi:FkbM family methyltransferase